MTSLVVLGFPWFSLVFASLCYVFDSFPWPVKKYFRDCMKQTIEYTNNLSNFDTGQQAEIAKALFGTEAGSKFLSLLNQSDTDITQMFEKIRNIFTIKKMYNLIYGVQIICFNIF